MGKFSSAFLLMTVMLVLSLVPIRSATAFENSCDGGVALSWSSSLSDVKLDRQSGCEYHYVSEQYQAGLVVSMTVSFPVPSGSYGFLSIQHSTPDPATGVTRSVGCGIWPHPPCDGQLSVSYDVSAGPFSEGYVHTRVFGGVRDLATGVLKSTADVYFTVVQSPEIDAKPQLLGDQKDNEHTEFDGAVCRRPVGFPVHSVNTATLNLVVQDTDFAYSGLGPDVEFIRTWNAAPSYPGGMFGSGWSFSYESTIRFQCNGVSLKRGAGNGKFYAANLCPASGLMTYPVSATPPEGTFDKLTLNEGNYWLLEEKGTGLTYRFDSPYLPYVGLDYRLTSIADRNGNAVSIAYNDGTLAHRIDSITDAAGRVTKFAYGVYWVTSMTLPDGRKATYAYDGGGNMLSNTDLLGTAITYTYDTNGYMTSVSYAGKTTQFAYDTSGGWKHISAVTDASGNTKKYAASSVWDTQITDPAGSITSYANRSGRTSGVTTPLGNTVSKTFNGGVPVSVSDARQNASSMEYDGSGNLVKATDPLGNVTTYTYDASGRITRVTDALGKSATYEYDAKGNLLKSVSPGGKTTTYTYDAKGQMTSVKGANGTASPFTYDGFGNVATVTDARGKTTTLGYDPFGFNKLSVTDPQGRVTRFAYDNNGRVTKITNPDGSFRTNTYDACSLVSATDENGRSATVARNGLLAVTGFTDAFGKSTATAYDANNNVTSITDPSGRVTSMAYDKVGRNVRTTNPSGTSVEKAYDANGNLTLLRDESGRATLFSYDAANQLISVEDPNGGKVSYTRNALGRMVGVTNARGASISAVYDDDGLLAGKAYSSGGSATYARDAYGNLTSVADAAGTTGYHYDSQNVVTGITYPDQLSLSFSADDGGRVSAVYYPGTLVVSYGYDDRNRVSSVSWGAGNSIAYTYDPTGNLTKVVRSNGTETGYAHDVNNRVIGIQHKKGAQAFAVMDYQRDTLGRILNETATLPVAHKIADESVSAVHNSVNQIVISGGDTYTYDADGNLTAIAGTQSLSATYDPENRLTSISQNGITTTYTYNGLGMRTKAVSGSQTRNFHHNVAGRLMFETDANGTVIASYIYAGVRLAAMVGPSGATYFYHFDKTGNTVALTDAEGSVAAAYAYEPFGKISNQTGSVVNPFTYVGALGVMDEGGGLYYMTNRYYDANTGRFLQKDPTGFPGGTNRYAYVGNNPIDAVDPLGLLGDDVGRGYDRYSSAARSTDLSWLTLPNSHALDRPLDWATNIFAGYGDALTTLPIPFTNWSFTRWARGEDDWAVDKSSLGYRAAGWAGTATQVYLPGGIRGAFDAGARTVCYTGEGAYAAAKATEGVLLESTVGGAWMNYIDQNFVKLPQAAWQMASALYVSNARGTVAAFIGNNVRADSIFFNIEMTLLRIKGNAINFVW